jgi:hypothetical protein
MNADRSFASTAAKLFIFFMGALSAIAGAWMILNVTELRTEEKGIVQDTKNLEQIEKIAPQLGGLVEAGITAQERQKEQSEGNWYTFFDNVASVCGLHSDQYVLPSRRTVPGRHYIEHRFDIKLKGVDRRSAARFLWEVEKRRSYLKASEVKLRRPKRKNQETGDEWDGNVVIAYRKKN